MLRPGKAALQALRGLSGRDNHNAPVAAATDFG